MSNYPSPENWTGVTPRQRQRSGRVIASLAKRAVPVFPGPLCVEDDAQAKLQSPSEVARRLLSLWVCDLVAENINPKRAGELIDLHDLGSAFSPVEIAFLQAEEVDIETIQSHVWGIESMWVLTWALGYLDDLEWPARTCTVEKMLGIVIPRELDPAFVTAATLRPTAEILDAQELTMRLHWAIRDAQLHHKAQVPPSLDWFSGETPIPIAECPACRVVQERHKALNWLVNFMAPAGWDEVDTPT